MVEFENPFTPSFGEIPAHPAGRKQIIDDLARALADKHRRPELTTIVSGARGTGKTALLSYVARMAEGMGWIVADTTALPGMLDDIEVRARRGSAHLAGEGVGTRVASFGIPQVLNVELEREGQLAGNWRSRMEDILDGLDEHGAGLLVTVDEVDVALDEMVTLAAVYQHFVREGRKVALLMAGLPHNISALMNDKTVSFLRRAQAVRLGRIDDYEIEESLRKTIFGAGRSISEESLKRAVRAIGGFPFMMQLVGYRMWDATPGEKTISPEDVERGIAVAREEMRARIFEATFRELSPEDIRFVRAMAEDEGDSRISDLVSRLGRSDSQVSQYRMRLIDAGVIGSRGRGKVGFDLPFFREFLIGDLREG